MRGGVANAKSLPAEFLDEMYAVGVRQCHYRGFISIIRHMFALRYSRRVRQHQSSGVAHLRRTRLVTRWRPPGDAQCDRRFTDQNGSGRRLFATSYLFGAPLDRGDARNYVSGGPLGDAIMFAMLTALPGILLSRIGLILYDRYTKSESTRPR